jgi:hypothetical protein
MSEKDCRNQIVTPCHDIVLHWCDVNDATSNESGVYIRYMHHHPHQQQQQAKGRSDFEDFVL